MKLAALGLLAISSTAMALTPPTHSPEKRQHVSYPFRHGQKQITRNGIVPSGALSLQAAPQSRVQRRVTSGGTNLYGYLYTFGTHGLYEFNPTGFSLLWRDPLWDSTNYSYGELEVSWYRNGKLCGFSPYFQYGYYWGQEYYEIDFTTGVITKSDEFEDYYMEYGYFISCCYDADEDVIYGYGTYDEDATSALFMKTSGSDVFAFEDIKDYGWNPSQADYNKQCVSMAWCSADKKLYGINLNKQLVTIDKTTGNQTVIMNVPVTMDLYVTGLAYSPKEDVFYWNCNYDKRDGTPVSKLYTIDVNSKTFTEIADYEGGESFATLMVVGDSMSETAPKKAELVSAEFGTGLTGTLTYKLPTALLNGTAITGTMNWTLNANSSVVQTGTGTAGATVSVPVEVATSGTYNFDFTVTYQGEVSSPTSYEIFLGDDRPRAPTNVTLTETLVYWTRVTEGMNGGYIDPSQVTYNVYLNNELVGTTTSNSYSITIPQDKPMQDWTAAVSATYNGQTSTRAYSNTIFAGGPWNLPFDMACTDENLKYFKVVNSNNDDETWEAYDWGIPPYYYSGQADPGQTGDDWLILPPINFSADEYVSFSISCRKHAGAYYPDTWLEVCYAQVDDPNAMQGNYILERFSPANRDFTLVTNPMFKMPSSGKWYIGVRCITNTGNLGCDVANIKVQKVDATPEGPAEATNVTIAPTADFALEATVTFTLPTQTLGGTTLPADTELTAKLICGSAVSTYTGKPGETLTGTIATEQGDNDVFLQCFAGDIPGASVELSVFTGVVTPGLVKNLSGVISKDMMSMNLTWDAPSADKSWEGKVNPATTWYIITVSNSQGYSQTYETAQGVTTYTATLPTGAAQDLYSVSVVAENVAGNNGYKMTLTGLMGTPYALPMVDEFNANGFAYQPWISYGEENSSAYWEMYALEDVASDWAGNKDIALVGYSYPEGTAAESMLGMPRFSTVGQEHVTVSMKYYAGAGAANLDLLGAVYGSEENQKLLSWVLTGQDSPEAFRVASVDLPATMLNQPWVQLYLDAIFGSDYMYAIITNISVTGSTGTTLMTLDTDGSVTTVDGKIEICGYAEKEYVVSGVNGAVYASGTLDGGENSISVPAGVYVVKTGEKSHKVIVR